MPLPKKDKYEIRIVLRKNYSIIFNNTKEMKSKAFIHKLDVQVHWPTDLVVQFSPQGNLKFAPTSTSSTNIIRGYSGLLFPYEGYMLTIRKRLLTAN
jgi:hypothetical protein